MSERDRDAPLPSPHHTTDPQGELFDVLTEDGRPTGMTKPRGLVHRDGDWHGALHIWIGGIGTDGLPFVAFQRRSLTKDTWPGALDVAIGGHMRAGESIAETMREGEEEIGLSLPPEAFIPIGRRFASSARDGVIDREVQDVYAVRCDWPLDAYTLHPQEVDGIVAIPVDATLALFRGDADRACGRECARGGSEVTAVFTLRDFVTSRDAYIELALERLQQVIAGDPVTPFSLRSTETTP